MKASRIMEAKMTNLGLLLETMWVQNYVNLIQTCPLKRHTRKNSKIIKSRKTYSFREDNKFHLLLSTFKNLLGFSFLDACITKPRAGAL